MIGRSTSFAIATLAMMSGAAAAELAPGNGYSLKLGAFGGTVYYTIEQDGYRIVATVASGTEQPPLRFVATLRPGQAVVFSVPQEVGKPPLDFEIERIGETLFVGEPPQTAGIADK
jgi:hypothetical protein